MIQFREIIEPLAVKYRYTLEQAQENIGLLIFTNGQVQINVYTTRMTVGTCLNHPKLGKTQLFRKHVSFKELEEIFKNPRVHLNAEGFRHYGYRRKR